MTTIEELERRIERIEARLGRSDYAEVSAAHAAEEAIRRRREVDNEHRAAAANRRAAQAAVDEQDRRISELETQRRLHTLGGW